jgi:hypothetical protein
LAWQDEIGSRVVEDGLFFSSETHLLYVADARISARESATGQEVASLRKGGADFLVTDDYVLSAGTAELGVQSWSSELADVYSVEYSRVLWPPAISGGTVYLLDRHSQLQVISLPGGYTVTWLTDELGTEPVSPPVFFNDAVYFIASDGSLRSVDPTTGINRQLLRSLALRHRGNIPGGFLEHYWPGVTAFGGGLIVSFGCKAILSITV